MNSEDVPLVPRISREDRSDITWIRQRPDLKVGTGCIVGLGIFCILIIAGYYGVSRVRTHGMGAGARSALQSVVNAVEQFEADVDRLPLPPGARAGRDFDTDTTGAAGVITALKGCDVTQNPKQTDYLGEIKNAKTIGGPRIVDGIYFEKEEVIALFDPWGLPYRMRLDGDGDHQVEHPDPDQPGARLSKRVVIWSAGKDGDFSTWNDNIVSW